MNADTAYMIGTSHSICQDYAVARTNQHDRSSYVILSDGCSTSPDTDIGARLIVKAAQQLIEEKMADVRQLHSEASQRALHWTRSLGLPAEAVDATLFSAYRFGDDLLVGCSGDGVVVLQALDNTFDVYSISFPSGFPLYPSYQYQPERLNGLLSNDRACKQVEHYRSTGPGKPLILVGTSINNGTTETFNLRANDYQFAVLLSDGVHSISHTCEMSASRSTRSVAMPEVIFELIDFKGGYGAFVQRRAAKLRKSFAANGWGNADDLAIAALHLGN